MTTIVLDFDSTLISVESFEMILEKQLRKHPEKIQRIHEITREGIGGQISFRESLEKRLSIACPNLEDVTKFGERAGQFLTKGMSELILDLQNSGIEVWLISGAPLEVLLPLGQKLGILKKRIFGVKLIWDNKGSFISIDTNSPFYISKVEGCLQLAKNWTRPVITVGDSMSDYNLYKENLAEYFIVYTEHIRCNEVIAKEQVVEARDTKELRKIIEGILGNEIIS